LSQGAAFTAILASDDIADYAGAPKIV